MQLRTDMQIIKMKQTKPYNSTDSLSIASILQVLQQILLSDQDAVHLTS